MVDVHGVDDTDPVASVMETDREGNPIPACRFQHDSGLLRGNLHRRELLHTVQRTKTPAQCFLRRFLAYAIVVRTQGVWHGI